MKQEEMSTGSYLLIIAVASVFLLFVYIAWISAPNFKGYCKMTQGYLTDEDKIRIAIESVLATYPPSFDVYNVIENKKNISRIVPEKPLFYRDVEEFLQVNPNCCKSSFNDNNYIDSVLIYRAMGKLSTIVNIQYKVRYYDDNNDLIEQYREEVVAITNCGRAWYP